MRVLNAAEVSVAAGTTEATVKRLAELGVLSTTETERLKPSDVRRARLVLALATSGVSLESVGEAVQDGRVSFDFIDELAPDPIPLLPETQRELVERLGLSAELARGLGTILGTCSLPADEQVRADHAELFELVAEAKEEGASDDLVVRAIRATADSMRHVVAAQRDFAEGTLKEPEGTASPNEILSATAAQRRRFLEFGRRSVELLHHRFSDEAVFQNVVEQLEVALAEERRARQGSAPAIAFVDISGYTRLAEELGDDEAATQAARFIEVVEAAASATGGSLVKVLGDGVMLHFSAAEAAVSAALNVLARMRKSGLPAVRAGINTGPMVRRDGDYFGTVVNIAARAADYARAHEILVTQDVVDSWTGGENVYFRAIGAVSLKNVRRPVELFQVEPA